MDRMKKSVLGAAIGSVLAMSQACSEAPAEQPTASVDEREKARLLVTSIKNKAKEMVQRAEKSCKDNAGRDASTIISQRDFGVPIHEVILGIREVSTTGYSQVWEEVALLAYQKPYIDHNKAKKIIYDRCVEYWDQWLSERGVKQWVE